MAYAIAGTYLQLPLRQWGAGNVYLLVLSSWKINIAENLIAIVVPRYIRALGGMFKLKIETLDCIVYTPGRTLYKCYWN